MAHRVKIGTAVVDFDSLRIEREGGVQSVEPKVMEVLRALVDDAPSVVTRDALIQTVWGTEFGGDESLSRAISLLRKALGEASYIETVPKRGYRMAADFSVAMVQPSSATVGESNSWGYLAVNAAVILVLGAIAWLFFSGDRATKTDQGNVAPQVAIQQIDSKSVAVLPFADMSPNGDQEYFSDGLSEEILNALTRISDLKVAGRTSAFAFKGQNQDLRKVGETLNVSHVLEGSVRKQGDRVRITAQLIQTSSGYHEWSDTFDGDLSDIFDLQERISRAIADKLEIVLDLEDQRRLAPLLTSNQQAYDLFLQGRDLSRRFGNEAKTKSLELLKQAVAIDPNFADAWALLARIHLFVPVTTPNTYIKPHVDNARAAVEKALSINPDLAMAHFVRSHIYEYELDFASATDAVKRAYELDPNNPFLAMRWGYSLGVIGQVEKAVEIVETGLRRDPTYASGIFSLSLFKSALGQLDEAELLARRSYDLGFKSAILSISGLHARRGDFQAATALWNAQFDTFSKRYHDHFQTRENWAVLGRGLYGGDAQARDEAAKAAGAYFSGESVRPNSYRVTTLFFLGAFDEFMEAYENHPYPINATGVSYAWSNNETAKAFRQHKEFRAFVDRLGLVKAWNTHGWPDLCRPDHGTDGAGGAFSCD